MFKKVLIANRGAIATRIIRTLKHLNVHAIAVYAEADHASLHVRHADEAWSLGDGGPGETYLDQDKILDLATRTGADAIHPGYGFLSENPDFVARCEKMDIAFIGPSAEHMRAFGLKHRAREIALKSTAPLLPGSALLEDAHAAIKAAHSIGYPVMLKSTAGGGGIGMQLCEDEASLIKAFDSVKRLSASSFSNDAIYLEKYIANARHIEVQAFGDGEGQIITLGERDCSCQRRNQKVIEEAPAPGISTEVRNALHDTARQLLSQVRYRNAGTVEFIFDNDTQSFYFLEVNTRLQVEHGVTEAIYNVDLVEWMVKLSAGVLEDLTTLTAQLVETGHAIQARIYAEDPQKAFQPSTGRLDHIVFPHHDNDVRIDHALQAGLEISPYYDPLLAKVIIQGNNRADALKKLGTTLNGIELYGIETNLSYTQQVVESNAFIKAEFNTRYLSRFPYQAATIDVLQSGTMTTIQDYPGRSGYWDVGVPPSGPFDNYAFRIGNRLLDNPETAAGLEITFVGPTLRFNESRQIIVTGAETEVSLDDTQQPQYQIIHVKAGQTLKIGKISAQGARCYLLIKGGLNCPDYLGSKSTFTLGGFGGHSGRAIRTGDVLHLSANVNTKATAAKVPQRLLPKIDQHWQIRVIYGPHGAPDFFTENDIKRFFESDWEVHYNSSRTGIRLVGPKPEWARQDGGEAGLHPSNLHDNAYAIGTVDFTGDMPVILGPDGPSLGGFVCPATVIQADLWKLGQLKAGNTIRFVPISLEDAKHIEAQQDLAIANLTPYPDSRNRPVTTDNAVVKSLESSKGPSVVYRPAGDKYLLVEYGAMVLDIELRFRVHALMLWLQRHAIAGMLELTPGIRSLQIHYDNQILPLKDLLIHLEHAETALQDEPCSSVPSRIVHLPLSWNDEACQLAVEKYIQSVRNDAPWCPDNIEFIRRINGLRNIEDVKKIVFDASYLVMGLGDVYLGAPVATPLDPRHRLVTTKYNPARTWTAENSVGIGGSYLCIYGMEGPGGYQFIGRTVQMWNRYHQTQAFEKPWLLRFFDQIRFFEVSHRELQQIRRDFPLGRYQLKVEHGEFNLDEYRQFLDDNKTSINAFNQIRHNAYQEELQRWIESGQINFEAEQALDDSSDTKTALPEDCVQIESPVAGSIWKVLRKPGDDVKSGDVLLILESMKMEIEVTTSCDGVLQTLLKEEGQLINAGQPLVIIKEQSS